MSIEQLERDLALYVLGDLPSDDIPALALCALELGHDTLEMAALAGEPASTHPADLRHALDAALEGAGIQLPSRRRAAEHLRRAFAVDAIAGHRSLEAAARAILGVRDAIRDELPDRQDWGDGFDVADLGSAFYDVPYPEDNPAAWARREDDLVRALRRLAGEDG